MLEEYNLTRQGREKMGNTKLAVIAGHYGGSANHSQWYEYITGRRPLPMIDKLAMSMTFTQYRVQDIFPSWPFPILTVLPPSSPLARMLAAPSMASVDQLAMVAELVELFVGLQTLERRAALLVHIKKLLFGSNS